MTKKILFIVNVDWFFISHRLPIALEAISIGYEVHIACVITDKKEYLESFGMIVHPIMLSRSGTHLLAELKSFWEVYTLLKGLKPHITHFVTIKPVIYGGIAAKIARMKNKVFSISGLGYIFISDSFKGSISRVIVKFLYRLALSGRSSRIVVQNRDDQKLVFELGGIQKSQITLIRGSGVDLKSYHCIDEKKHPLRVVMASRLLKDKGVYEYLEAAKILISKGLDVEFELYGDIDEGNPTSLTHEELMRISNDGFVNVQGYSNTISKVFSSSNIVVLPSYREGLPKVLIEAAACGRAIVTTNVAGCRDAVEENVTGLLAIVKDSKSLADTIARLLENKELRLSMGKAGRELAEKEFDVRNVVNKHFEIYNSLED